MSAAFTFEDLFYTLLLLLSLWVAGKLFSKLGLPALVGEICIGILMGPHGLNKLNEHFVISAKLIGEIGLLLLVLEAGLDVDIAMLKIIGTRGLAVGVIGSLLPLGIGFGLALAMGSEMKAALCIGATLAPTSMGIALNVLRSGKVLNTPTGQLVIAAAVLDDVLALIILSEIKALGDPKIINFVAPVVVSAFFILLFGYLAVKVLPHHLEDQMNKIKREKDRENLILALMFGSTLIMMPTCYYLKSSYLLGAFLAGFIFCTDHNAHSAWIKQVKRIMQWMLRIFFGCTIAFEVPIGDFWTGPVLKNACVYMVAIIGKLVQGFWASPLQPSEFWKIAWAMAAWGEFAFIIAGYSKQEGLITKDEFSSLILAVLVSVLVSPVMLGLTIKHYTKKADDHMDKHIDHDADVQNVFYYIDMRARPKWGIQDKIHDALDDLGLEVVDFRAWHARNMEDKGPTFVFNEIYLRDHKLEMPSCPFMDLTLQNQEMLEERVHKIHEMLDEVIQLDPKKAKKMSKEDLDDENQGCVNISRWIPHQDETPCHSSSEEEHVHMTFEPEYTLHHIDPDAGGNHGHGHGNGNGNGHAQYHHDKTHATLAHTNTGHFEPGHVHTSHRLNKIAVKALHGYVSHDVPHDPNDPEGTKHKEAIIQEAIDNPKTTGLDILQENQNVEIELQEQPKPVSADNIPEVGGDDGQQATQKDAPSPRGQEVSPAVAVETVAVAPAKAPSKKRHKKRTSNMSNESFQGSPGSPKRGSPRKIKKTLRLTSVEKEDEMTLKYSSGPRQRTGKLDILHTVMSKKNTAGHGARDVANIVRMDLGHKEHHAYKAAMEHHGTDDKRGIQKARWKHKRAPLKGGSSTYYR